MTPAKKTTSKKTAKKSASKTGAKKRTASAQQKTSTKVRKLGQAFVAGMSAGGGYATMLTSRGSNVQQVQALEHQYGHTGTDQTPYAVACSTLQSTAQAIAAQFQAIGASASVQPGC